MKRISILAALLLLVTGCSFGSSTGPQVSVTTDNGEYSYEVEIADTVEKRTKGLMSRDALDSDKGMLFLFDEPAKYKFHMNNVRFSIDMIFLDENKKVVSIASSTPPCRSVPCTEYVPAENSQYVLELLSGKSKEMGLKKGDLFEWSL